MEVLGETLISELGHRGQRGMYFQYDAYQKLKHIDNVEEMQPFFDSNGYRSVLAADDPVRLADGLEEAIADETPPWWVEHVLPPLAYPIWLLTRIRKKRRVFPRRRKNSTRYRKNHV